MTTDRTIRNAKAIVWALVAATIVITGIATAQEDIGIRAVVFIVSLIPAGPAILLGAEIHYHSQGNTTHDHQD